MFHRNITLGHRFWSRKLSRKVNCWRAEFKGELSRSNTIKNWRLYSPTAYSWSKERREHFFFSAINEKIHHDGSESKAKSAGIKCFISLPQNYITSRACSSFGSVRSSYIMSFIFYLSLSSVVWRPISAKVWLSFNCGIFSFCPKTFFWKMYAILFRADLEHPIIKWENWSESAFKLPQLSESNFHNIPGLSKPRIKQHGPARDSKPLFKFPAPPSQNRNQLFGVSL